MDIVNGILGFIVSILSKLLPALGFDSSFMSKMDELLSLFIDIIQAAGWLIPLDVLVMCMTAMFVVDNFALMSRLGQWVIRLIRG